MSTKHRISANIANAYNLLQVPTAIVNDDLSIVFVNDSLLTAFALEERRDLLLLNQLFVHPFFASMHLSAIQSLFSDANTHESISLIVTANAKTFLVQAKLVHIEEIQFCQMIFIQHDVSFDLSSSLQAHRELHEIYAQSTGEVIYYFDYTSCIYTYFSSNCQRVLGYTIDEINLKGLNKIIRKHEKIIESQLPEDHQSAHPLLGNSVGNEYQIRLPDGSSRWIAEKALKIKDASGKNVGQFGSFRDSTAEKGMVVSLREAHKNLQHLMDATPIGISIIQKGRIAYANQEMMRIFGAANADEVIGKSMYQFIPKEQLRAVAELIVELNQSKEPLYEFELELYSLDKSRISVAGSMIPISHQGNNAIQIIFRDITRVGRAKKARRATLKILQASDTILDLKDFFSFIHQTLSESMPVNNFYIALLDKATNMLTFPYGVDEFDTFEDSPLNEKSLTNLVLTSGAPMLISREEDERLRGEGLVDLIGEPAAIWLGVPLKIQNEAIGVMVVQDYQNSSTYTLRDKEMLETVSYSISYAIERKRREAERLELIDKLKEINAAKDAFFSIISHDLRSPFTSIMGFISILLHDYQDLTNDEVHDILSSLNNVTNNVLNMVINLLEFSRFQMGRMEYRPTELAFRKLVQSVISMLQGNIQKKNLNIQLDIPPGTMIIGDEKMMISVFQNLLSNAIKFSFNGKSIYISINSEPSNVSRIVVRDEGMGMTEDQVKNLFKLDKIQSRPGTQNEHGTGIGLVLVKDFIKQHGGKVEVESSITAGTSFIISIPGKSI